MMLTLILNYLFINSVSTVMLENPCHAIIAGHTIYSNLIYNVAILTCTAGKLNLHAAIQKDDLNIAFTNMIIPSAGIYLLPIKIPTLYSNGNYQLKINGNLIDTNLKFTYTRNLNYTCLEAVILVETNRPLYTSNQTVRFRVIVLQRDLLPSNDGVDIFIMDPDGYIVRRWMSVYVNNGVISLKYLLPKYVKEGYWKIRIKLNNQIKEQIIKIENFFEPIFDVYLNTPTYLTADSKTFIGNVYGMRQNQEIINVNATIKLAIKQNDNTYRNLHTKHLFIIERDMKIELPINVKYGDELKFEAFLTDTLSGEEEYGFSLTRIVSDRISIRFLQLAGTLMYQPNFPFSTQITVEYTDGRSLPEDILNKSTVQVYLMYQKVNDENWIQENLVTLYPSSWSDKYIMSEKDNSDNFHTTGILNILIKPPKDSKRLKITAILNINNEKVVECELFCISQHELQLNGPYMKLSTSTNLPILGEYAIFHVYINHQISEIYYITVSNGNCQSVGTQIVHQEHSITTFALPLSREIALPYLTLIVFGITQDGMLISDSLKLPLIHPFTYNMELTLNRGKDFKGDIVEIIVNGDDGAYICVSSSRQILYKLHIDNIITADKVNEASIELVPEHRWINKVIRPSNNKSPRKVKYFQTQNYGFDTKHTLKHSGVFIVTNLRIHEKLDLCKEDGIFPCFNEGKCFTIEQHCDGINHCFDGTDEMNCWPKNEDDFEFIFSRISRTSLLYDKEDGDWGHVEIKKNDHEGQEFELINAPKMGDEWYFNAFSVSSTNGISIIEEPVIYSTERGWSAFLSGPKECHRGEQLGLTLIMCNHDPIKVFVLVTLKSSPNYKFIQVGENGIVSSYNPILTAGEKHLLIYMAAGKQTRLDVPIVPQVESGPVTVTLIASTHTGYSLVSHTVNVIPEGSEVVKYTSRLIDLRNRAFEQLYFEIPIAETPIVPYQEIRNYIYGSAEASVTITASLLGPFTSNGISLRECLSRNPSKGTDSVILEFSVNIWTLHYRRFTSQIKKNYVKNTLELCNQLYANLLSRMNPNGGFFNWDGSTTSVWLTAWVLRGLRPAVYADWENILYIDSLIFDKTAEWLILHQTANGAFIEENLITNVTICSTIDANVTVALITSEVVIALSEVVELLSTGTRNLVITAINKATIYLEQILNTNSCLLNDSRHISAIAYALLVSNKILPEKLIKSLEKLKKTDKDGFNYWSPIDIKSAPIRLEHNRPVLQSRNYVNGLSNAIYSTSYALLTILAISPFSPQNDLILAWLLSVKMNLNGFISFTDTMVGYQALTEYANRIRLLELTKMNISITSSSDSTFIQKIAIDKNVTDFYTRQVPNPWGILEIRSKGYGLSLFQLISKYRVDRQELTDKSDINLYKLNINQYYSSFRNKSSLTIEVCTKWLDKLSLSSGFTTLEIDTPTGYFTTESRLFSNTINDGLHPTLCDVAVSSSKIVFYFSHITSETYCFNYTLKRLYPVANMTLHRKAIIYENNRRENFAEVVIESTPLYVLSICEVCGSYQCPYCPHYNSAPVIKEFNLILIFFSSLTAVFFRQIYQIMYL